MKRAKDSLRDLWDNIKCTNIQIIEVPEEEEKKKGYEKIFEEIIVEHFPNMEKEIVKSSPRGTKSPIQDKPKEKHAKTDIIKLTKTKQKKRNVKNSKGEAMSNIQGKPHTLNS